MTKPVQDPWLLDSAGNPDPFAGNVDFSLRPEDAIDPDAPMLDIHPGLVPDVVVVEGERAEEPAEAPAPPPLPEPEPDEPETMELEDGTQLILEKERGQWKGTVASGSGAGQPQIYWGRTKNELFFNLMKAQANATKKIRELNRKNKLAAPSVPASQPVVPSQASRVLTAEEIFEIKTQMESNPEEGFENLFKKKYGVSLDQIVQQAQRGAQAEANLQTEAVCREFLAKNPDWYNDNQNFLTLVQWLAKFKLGKTVTSAIDGMYELHYSGYWTTANLEEAFEDLSSDGLLNKAPVVRPPKTPPPVTVSQEPAPAPRPNSERIVQVTTRPRAATGLQRSDVTPVAEPISPTALPAEEHRKQIVNELDSASDDDVAKAWAAVRRQRVLARRS